MSNPLKLCKATASSKLSEEENERLSPEAASFGRGGKASWLTESVLCCSFCERSLYQSMVKNNAFLQQISKSLKRQTLTGQGGGGRRSNFVLVAIRFEVSLFYWQNRTEAVPYAGVNTDSQGEDKHRCS